jgi:hypothetical protein
MVIEGKRAVEETECSREDRGSTVERTEGLRGDRGPWRG